MFDPSLFEEMEPQDDIPTQDAPAFMDEARKLIPEWLPWGIERHKSSGAWGIPPFGSIFNKDGRITVWNFGDPSKLTRKGAGYENEVTLDQLKSAAVSILVFCAAEEMRKEELENG